MKSFTLIETLVVIVVFSLVLGALSSLVVAGYKNYQHIWQQSLAVDEARHGIEVMVKEIREARQGDDGSYPIALAADKEFIFFSDIDKDGETERVRYFLGSTNSDSQIKECVTFDDGGSCSVVFSDFLSGTLESAEIRVSVEGDFGWSQEYAEITVDGQYLGDSCRSGCSDCPGLWEGTGTFDVTDEASDGSLGFIADSTYRVNDVCDWQEPNHAMKAKFELSWTEELPDEGGEFKKGIINPVGYPAEYPPEQEEVSILTHYVRNAPPIFEYFDGQGNKIEEYPARLKDTKVMKVFLIIDVDPNRLPDSFELESRVHLRNLETAL